jgi:hypothetical protein
VPCLIESFHKCSGHRFSHSFHRHNLGSLRAFYLPPGLSLSNANSHHANVGICQLVCIFPQYPSAAQGVWELFVNKFNQSVNNSLTFIFTLWIILPLKEKNIMEILSNELDRSKNAMTAGFSFSSTLVNYPGRKHFFIFVCYVNSSRFPSLRVSRFSHLGVLNSS